MADNKPILSIDVDDTAFKSFLKAFDDYSEKLKAQPEQWKKLNEALKKTGLGFSAGFKKADIPGAADAIKQLQKHLGDAAKAQKRFTDEAHKSGKAMGHIEKTVKGIGKGIAGLSKAVGILSGVGMIGGIAGLAFGIPDLAQHVLQQGRSAKGLGISVGANKAFTTYMKPYLPNAEGFLQGIANAQMNQTSTMGLSQLTGKSYQQVQSESANVLAVQAAKAAHSFFKKFGKANTQSMLQAYGLSSVFTLEVLRTLQNSNYARLSHAGSEALSTRNQNAMGWSRSATASLQKFAVQLSHAGAMIDAAFVKRLAVLGPELSKFSNVIAGDVVKFINSVMTPKNMEEVALGIGSFVKFIGSKKFLGDLQTIGEVIGNLASDMSHVAKIMNYKIHVQIGPFSKKQEAGWMSSQKEKGHVRIGGSDTFWGIKNGEIYAYLHNPITGGAYKHDYGPVSSHPRIAHKIREGDQGLKPLLNEILNELKRANSHHSRGETPGTVKTQSRNTAAHVATSAYAAGGGS